MSTVLQPNATVADAIEQTLEWLDRQGCGERNGHDRRYNRRVQGGTQNRSDIRKRKAINLLHAGLIGGPLRSSIAVSRSGRRLDGGDVVQGTVNRRHGREAAPSALRYLCPRPYDRTRPA